MVPLIKRDLGSHVKNLFQKTSSNSFFGVTMEHKYYAEQKISDDPEEFGSSFSDRNGSTSRLF